MYGDKYSNPYYQAAIRRNIENNAHKGKLARKAKSEAAAREAHPEAVAYLESGEGNWSNFISDVASRFKMYGTLSAAQAAAVLKVKAKSEARKAAAAAEPKVDAGAAGMATIAKLLKTAAASGKFKRAPKFLIGVYTVGGALSYKLKVYTAGARSSWKGWLQVKRGSDWLGRINPETGEVHGPKLKGNGHALDALKAFEADPFGSIKKFGALSSDCCFCGHELTDDRSRSKGYGPVCATHWGLPWG